MIKLFISLFLSVACVSCINRQKADDQASEAYERGLTEGQNKGYEEGQAEGYKRGYDQGYDEGYDQGYAQGYDETQRPIVEEKHGYEEHTYSITCPNCGGDGLIDGISKKEICPTCQMSGVIKVTEKNYY